METSSENGDNTANKNLDVSMYLLTYVRKNQMTVTILQRIFLEVSIASLM